MRLRFFLALLACVLIAATVWADGSGGYAGAFLRLGMGAEPVALGGAFTAVPNSGYSLLFNPAGLSRLGSPQLRASYAVLGLDRQLSYVGFTVAVGTAPDVELAPGESRRPRAGIGLGWVHAGVDNIDGRDFDGRHTMTLSNSENAFYLGFAMQPHRLVSIGLAGKVLYNRLPGVKEDDSALTTSGFGVDIGAMVGPVYGLFFGATIHDLNSRYTWNTQDVWERGTTTTDRFPKVWRIGASYQHPEWPALFVLQLEGSDRQDPRIQLGAQWQVVEAVFLRAGLNRDRPTFGFGLGQSLFGRSFVLNYGYTSLPEAPRADHWLGWVIHF